MNWKAATILKAAHHIVTTYKTGGFQITSILEIWPLSGSNVILNISSNKRNKPEQFTIIYLSKNYPPRLVIEMAQTLVYWLNNFPAERAYQIPSA